MMATYACNKCGMAVNTNCAKCDVALVDDSLELDNGTKVQIAKCPAVKAKSNRQAVVARRWRAASSQPIVKNSGGIMPFGKEFEIVKNL